MKLTPRDRVRNLTQPGRFSKRSLAAAIGVSEKTIRRVVKGEREFSTARFDREVFKALEMLDRETRVVLKAEAKAEGIYLPPLRVIPPVTRNTWVDPFDPEGKARVSADTIDYDLTETEEDVTEEKMTDQGRDLFAILKYYRDQGNLRGVKTAVRFKVSTFKYTEKGTAMQYYWWPSRAEAQPLINDMSDDDLRDLILEVFVDLEAGGQMHAVRLIDPRLAQ